MEKTAKEILESAIHDANSEVYLCKNPQTVRKYLWLKGFDIPIDTVKAYLLALKSAPVINKNYSERKIAEVSRPFAGKQAFFSSVHGDIAVLSKKRHYGTKEYLILLIVDFVSNFTFLEKIKSTKFLYVRPALERIFSRSTYLPEKCDYLIYDGGIEMNNNEMKKFLLSHGIRLSVIRPRFGRMSKGSGLSEVTIKRFRKHLESYYREKNQVVALNVALPLIEKSMNNESLSCLQGLSSNQALNHKPDYIAMLKHSMRFRRRRYLKAVMKSRNVLKVYSIVRINKFIKKQKFVKESYGVNSEHMFIVLKIVINDFVPSYTLGSLFTLEPVFDCLYTHYELTVVPISYPWAVYYESINNPGPVVSKNEATIEFQPKYSKNTYIASKLLFS